MEDTQREIVAIVENTMCEFNSAMKRREGLIVRISNQTTQIIRFSMIGLFLLTFAVFALILILLSDMGSITQRLDEVASSMHTINRNIMVVGDNIQEMTRSVILVKQSIDHLDEHVKILPLINGNVEKINNNMSHINQNIYSINSNIMRLNKNINIMSIDITRMTHQVGGLKHHLGVMGHNVDRMAAPIKMFPFP